jgi:hypothetical protein
VEAQVQSDTNIAKNPLQCSQVMNIPCSMHVQADLLNCVSNICPSEDEVLQGSNKPAKVSCLRC